MDEQQQPLSWQFILLVVALLLLIPLVIMAPGDESRAVRPVAAAAPVEQPVASPVELGDLALTEVYTDASGLSIGYPAGWMAEAPAPGMVLVSNYEGALLQAPSAANQTVVLGRLMDFAEVGLEPGTQAQDIMADLVSRSEGSIEEVSEVTVGGFPGVMADFSQNGLDIRLVLSTPQDGVLVMFEVHVFDGSDEAIFDAFSAMLDSVVLPELGE